MININTFKSEGVWAKAEGGLINQLDKMAKEGKSVLLLLSGGTATKLYPKLAEYIKNSQFKGALAQVDERFQPESSDSVNASDIEKTGLWQAAKEKGISCFQISQLGTLEESAKNYNVTMLQCYKDFDLKMAVLGIGPDGHTAGLLPGYKNVWNIEQLVAGYVNKGLYPKRISLTPKALMELDYSLVVAGGEGKKEAITNALDSNNLKKIDQTPAVLIQKMKRVELYTDNEIPS